MTFICDICNKDFPSLYELNRHKNGKKSCEDKLIINYNSILLQEICNRDNCIIDYSTIEKYNRAIKIEFICSCGKIYSKNFRDMYNYGANCDKCTEKKRQDKRKQTCLEKYGVENANKTKETRDKIKKTNLEKYGVEHPSQLQEIKEKVKQTCLDKYGVEHPLQSNLIKERFKQTCLDKYGVENPNQNKEVRNKTKQTCLDKYGVEYSLQAQEVKDKSKEYFIKTYGVENASQVQENKNKKEQKAIEIYGVKNISQSDIIKSKKMKKSLDKYDTEHVFQSQEFKNKSKESCLDKYGVEYPMQNAEVSEKSFKNSYKLKQFTFPCGNNIQVQGYEPFLLDILVKEGYTYDEIITKRTDVPEIWYDINGIKKRYYCDIYIPKTNTIYEVKSTWTNIKDIDKNKLKKQACIDNGYNFKLYIFGSKGIRQLVLDNS